MNERVVGYILLGVGLLVIAGAAVSAVMVLSGNSQPVGFLVQNAPLSLDLSLPNEAGGQTQVPVTFGDLPLFRVVNAGLHLVLMGFLVSVGAKVATLGTNLIRPIVVKAKEQNSTP